MGGTVVAVGRKASTASAVLICRLLRGSRVGGTNTGTSVLDWPVGHGELSEVVSDHLWLDFDSGEGLARDDRTLPRRVRHDLQASQALSECWSSARREHGPVSVSS